MIANELGMFSIIEVMLMNMNEYNMLSSTLCKYYFNIVY